MSADRPRPVPPVVHPRIAGEGVWRATQARFAGGVAPPVLVTTYRPDPSYPRVVAGLGWIDARRANVSLYAGILMRRRPSNNSALFFVKSVRISGRISNAISAAQSSGLRL